MWSLSIIRCSVALRGPHLSITYVKSWFIPSRVRGVLPTQTLSPSRDTLSYSKEVKDKERF